MQSEVFDGSTLNSTGYEGEINEIAISHDAAKQINDF